MIQSKLRGSLLCAAVVAATGMGLNAQTLSQKWQNTTVGTSTRDLAFNPATGNLLLVHTTPKITRWKSADGTSAGSDLNITGISGGTFQLSGIATLKDGTIFACNYVTGAQSTTPLKLYRWDNENATPTNVASLGTLPGGTTDRFGAAMKVFVSTTSTNFLIAGNATTAYLLINSGTNWTFKQLTVDSQVMTPAGTIIDYNAPGFANQFRVVAKSRGSGGQLYNFDPSSASPINLAAAANKTGMSGEWAFKANGITSHDYDPNTGLLAGTTSTLQGGTAFDYTNMIFSTVGGVAAPVELSRLHFNATAADGGTAGGTKWGNDGRLYATIPVAGVGIQAFDISAFLVKAPVSLTKVSGQNATFTSIFGGSALTYTWKKGTTVLSDGVKYSGATNASITIFNLNPADGDSYTVTATDANGGTATATVTLTIAPSKNWSGGGADNNFSSAANWGGIALSASGDTAVFPGTTRLNPVVDSAYNISGLYFGTAAGAYNITNSGSGTLTLAGTLVSEAVAAQTLSLPVDISGQQTIDIAGPVTIAGSLTGSSPLVKTGSGTLTLSGNNNFTGTITNTSGTLSVVNGNAISDVGTIALATGGILSVDSPETIGGLVGGPGSVVLNAKLTIGGAGGTYTGGISGTNNLEIATTGTQAINAATTYTGRTILTAGTLSANDATTFGNGTGALQFNGGTLFRASQTTAQTFGNPVNVTANSTLAGNPVSGTRQVIFSTASLTATNGTLVITNTAASGSGVFQVRFTATSANSAVPIELAQGAFGTVELVLTNNATGTQVISGNISGNGKVIKNGTSNARQTTLSGANTFSGGLDILGGRVNLNNNSAAGAGVINVGTNANTIDIATTVNSIVISNDVVLAAAAKPRLFANAAANGLNFAGVISGSGAICRDDGGTGTLTLSGDNTFSGGVFITNRTFTLGHKNALGTGPLILGPDITVNAPTLQSTTDLTGPNAVANTVTMLSTNFTMAGNNNLELSGDFSLSVEPSMISATGTGRKILSGSITGGVSLKKANTGTLVLTHDNSYGGQTIVNGGVLEVDNVSGSGTSGGAVVVNTNATLAGSGYISGPVSLDNGGIINAGGVGSAGTLTLYGGADLSAGGSYRWELLGLKDDADGGIAGIDFDRLAIGGGSLTLGGNSKLVIAFPTSTVTPDFTNAYWSTSHKWTIIPMVGGGNPTSAGFTTVQTVATNYAGTFTSAVEADGSISLSFAPAGPTAPIILASPSSKTIVQGTNTTFSVSATGTAPLSYQWYFGTQPIGGETNATLTVSNAQPGNEGSYYAKVINSVSTTDSAAATLTVIVPPTITSQPQSQTVDVGATNVSFNVGVSGSAPFAYQWKKGGANISGATNSIFTIATVTTNDAASYSVTVTNLAGSTLSSNALLTIGVAAPPTLSFGLTNQTGTLVWTSVAGRTYRPQYKLDLGGANWTDIPPDVVAAGTTSFITNNVAGTNAAYYRVILLP